MCTSLSFHQHNSNLLYSAHSDGRVNIFASNRKVKNLDYSYGSSSLQKKEQQEEGKEEESEVEISDSGYGEEEGAPDDIDGKFSFFTSQKYPFSTFGKNFKENDEINEMLNKHVGIKQMEIHPFLDTILLCTNSDNLVLMNAQW
jgi:hypothetical protein